MCTPALPKPSPAKVAASAISWRASASSPWCTARRKAVASRDIAFSDHMSEIGLAPQYGTRCSGCFLSYDVNGRAV